ncbi:universal stress protein [Methylobacterium sp. ID0610]|uniref:universal stress protein n=1 Tax=Methylobacterium carpenticola TaxID=3344827 RepID=UPI003686FB33
MTRTTTSPLSTIRDVLVGLTEEGRGDEPPAAIGYGLTLAAEAGAHLTVQAASRRIVAVGASIPGLMRSLVAAENRRLDRLAHAVAERAAGDAAMAGVACTVEAPSLSQPALLARLAWRARLHDLTVLDAEPWAEDIDRDLIEAVLFSSGRPVIVVPPNRNTFRARRIMIAWDGSASAARAINDAMPLLRAADTVEVVSVVGEKELPSSALGAEIAPHLVRHGVNATVTELPMQASVADTLRLHVDLTRADVLVMGAFRHGRLREWLFGGVTQSLLGRSPVPLFLAH